jgi:CMP-N,N'-diacetyllegionaminic acid synthase
LIGIKSNELLFKNRQSLPKTYRPNGAIYIYQVTDLLYYQDFHLINTATYIMEKGKSLDIDDITDFEKIESILS